MANKYLDDNGLLYFWQKIKTYFTGTAVPNMDGTAATGTSTKLAREDHVHPSDNTKVDKVSGKGLSTNDFTTALKNKLDGIEAGAQANQNAIGTLRMVYPNPNTQTGFGFVDMEADTESDIKMLRAGDNIEFEFTETSPTKTDGVTINSTATKIWYGECSTSSATVEKIVTCEGFEPTDGTLILIRFEQPNSADFPTLNINNTGAYRIFWDVNSPNSASSGYFLFRFQVNSSSVDHYQEVGHHTVISTRNPKADGEAASGTSMLFSREDHVHPSRVYYATCPTAAATAAKVATSTISPLTASALTIGVKVVVYFTNKIDIASATLNVDGTGALPIYYRGAALAKGLTVAKGTYEFVYNGSQWGLVGDLDTTFSAMSASEAKTGTATTNRVITAKVLADEIDRRIDAAQVGAATFQGTVNAPTDISGLTSYKKGYYWVVATAGTYAGEVCEVGDMIFCVSDYSSSYKASDFSVVQNNLNLVAILNTEIDTIVAS